MNALARQLADFEDALEHGVGLALDGTPTREAATEVYNLGLRPDAAATFAIRGIAAYINDRLSVARDAWAEDDAPGEIDHRREPQSTARGRLSALPRHYARDHWERVLTAKNWEGADGRRKTLLAFTFEDATLRLNESKAQAVGHMKIAEAMTLVISLLSKHKALTVADLPVKAKVAIAEAVA